MKTLATLADRANALPRADMSSNALQRPLERLAERALRARLSKLAHGEVTLVDGARREVYGRATPRCALRATVHVRDARFYAEAAFGGSVGAGESFMAGDWTVDDLTALVRILLVNRGVLDALEGGWSRVTEPVRRLLHAAARNTRAGSRRNIAAHYDIGNDFFERFLDPTMMYSCAVFEREDMSLEQAQLAKLDRLCRKLDLQPGDHLLEIGTGWGALALHAARHYGCRVTTTTISRKQHELARRRVEAAGLAERITLRLDDYRDLEGRYDKLVSVEMIEAVGHQYFDTFFRKCGELLAPGGTMVLQAITIDDRQYAAARDSVDFIKRHIFPGCCIPSVTVLAQSAARASALRIVDLEDIGPHYATTLAAWHRNLLANADDVRARGYPEALLRMWHFYLGYCEGGFVERALGDVQIVLQDFSSAVRRRTPRRA
ncbi:MAG TPA: cyclopropane-fatty-acyl-phospholipid synthase family protein [Paraburkholderia sp.]|uniref:cyclopropane-fatty-acyl-phospholipid synthase family protein n=1 Tax=Paraburkholderia sp. TaxID=1926495 RepID=UPI002CE07E74|nr:cyclopropane-fatty-acyl-phospholipid synthase family protein [Paraburkholderia sp.]HTR11093.1 cyclopropane-fatty-acyl-phospholipid synthase family protein [Paraburkholderia sp.]